MDGEVLVDRLFNVQLEQRWGESYKVELSTTTVLTGYPFC